MAKSYPQHLPPPSPPFPPWQRSYFLSSAISAHPFPEGGGSSHPLLTSLQCPPSPQGAGAEIASVQDVEGIRGQERLQEGPPMMHEVGGGAEAERGWHRAGEEDGVWGRLGKRQSEVEGILAWE